MTVKRENQQHLERAPGTPSLEESNRHSTSAMLPGGPRRCENSWPGALSKAGLGVNLGGRRDTEAGWGEAEKQTGYCQLPLGPSGPVQPQDAGQQQGRKTTGHSSTWGPLQGPESHPHPHPDAPRPGQLRKQCHPAEATGGQRGGMVVRLPEAGAKPHGPSDVHPLPSSVLRPTSHPGWAPEGRCP